ncbi:beta-CASP ribonuclease aCPSF1, partial [archaeon]|nr:beta-CASP ribonuclease aCPSF1 [archaeon]
YTEDKKSVDYIRLVTLGGFREVGRSCLLFQTPESNVMVDCGISVKKDSNPYPHLDAPEFKIQDLDAVVLSHSHMDHCGMLPFLYKFGFKGPLYCTAPTRDTSTMLQLDFLKINKREGTKPPFQSKDIEELLKHCITLNYGEVTDITPDMRLTLSNAGHLLGSSTVHLHVGDGLHNVLYTSDMKYAPTKLFAPASTNFTRVETLIIESTYGTKITQSHKEAEIHLMEKINETLDRGGKVIIPSFAVGRSQDVVATIAESDINVPIYLDGMIWDATAIHTAYPEFMSKEMQDKILHKGKNPFIDPRIRGVGSGEERRNIINEKGPSVILSTSGMMVGGPIMEYMRNLSHDPKNMLIFVGYQGEGTMGRRIQKGWKMVNVDNARSGGASVGKGLELKLQIETVNGLGGHSDQNQLMSFIEHLKTKPKRIITDHGEPTSCISTSRNYHQTYHVRTQAPSNLEAIRIR